MTYNMVVLVLATLFGLDAYEAALAIFIASDQPVSLRERCSSESQSNALNRAAPRVNAPREMGPSFAENFRKSPPPPTFKKPLKPPLLLV
jgi:hypothetical protein